MILVFHRLHKTDARYEELVIRTVWVQCPFLRARRAYACVWAGRTSQVSWCCAAIATDTSAFTMHVVFLLCNDDIARVASRPKDNYITTVSLIVLRGEVTVTIWAAARVCYGMPRSLRVEKLPLHQYFLGSKSQTELPVVRQQKNRTPNCAPIERRKTFPWVSYCLC
jgi:hypothetical protein